MSKEDFTDSYGEGASIQDVQKQESTTIKQQQEERRKKAREKAGFFGSQEAYVSESDTAVKEKLAINQAEARKRREEEAATPQQVPASTQKAQQQSQQLQQQSMAAAVPPSPATKGAISPSAQRAIKTQEEKKQQVSQSQNAPISIDPEILNKFTNALDKFNSDLSSNIDRLENTKFQIQLDPTVIRVDLNGGSFLENLKGKLKDELLKEIGSQIRNQGFNPDGSARSRQGSQLG